MLGRKTTTTTTTKGPVGLHLGEVQACLLPAPQKEIRNFQNEMENLYVDNPKDVKLVCGTILGEQMIFSGLPPQRAELSLGSRSHCAVSSPCGTKLRQQGDSLGLLCGCHIGGNSSGEARGATVLPKMSTYKVLFWGARPRKDLEEVLRPMWLMEKWF